MVRKFYVKLCTTERSDVCDTSSLNFPSLNHSNLRWLNHSITEQKIDKAGFQMVAHKASGPDGFPLLFYKKILAVN